MPTAKQKGQFNVLLSEDGCSIVYALTQKYGFSQAKVIEYVLREFARRKKMDLANARQQRQAARAQRCTSAQAA